MKTVYIAEDGTFFNSERECLEYEFGMKNAYYVKFDGAFESGEHKFAKKCEAQRFVADVVHSLTIQMDSIERLSEITVTVRRDGKTMRTTVKNLLEVVPAHFKINAVCFNSLIK